ncbi:MAG: PA14 domain-containing protein [Pseudomonadota bacterium]
MRAWRTFAAAGAAITFGVAVAAAQPLSLSPADPQPDEATLKPGLAVDYAFPPEVLSLRDAEYWLGEQTKPGEPLIGFDYPDTDEGDPTLTSGVATRVAARITGYVKFDAAGTYDLEFEANDGLAVTIGGQEVSRYDGRHPCESTGASTVSVPEAGWYEIEAIYFQRLSTSCLLMKWGEPGTDLGWTPNEAFGH